MSRRDRGTRAGAEVLDPIADRLVVVGVSGGIAAYKACELVRGLVQRGAKVVVVMTQAATEFVTPLTFQTLSGNPVTTHLWGDQSPRLDVPPAARSKLRGRVEHVDLAEAADVVVIAPATADVIARIVHGEAPDALTSLVLASRAPLVVCPAMDVEMWKHAATQENQKRLRMRGARVVGPESGSLASGLDGPGRLAAVESILEAVARAVALTGTKRGRRVRVSAGRTEEAIDPVRVLSNRSSGKMGVALAESARDRGADVTLVLGPADVEPPGGVNVVRVRSAAEMEQALRAHIDDAQVMLMAAAVADYRPARVAREKLKRSNATRSIDLVPNPDVLAGLAARRKPGQVFVGFALETTDAVRHARAKLSQKKIDLIVLNAPADALGRDTNRVTLIESRTTRRLPVMSKRDVADAILARVVELGASKPARSRTPAARGAAQRQNSRRKR